MFQEFNNALGKNDCAYSANYVLMGGFARCAYLFNLNVTHDKSDDRSELIMKLLKNTHGFTLVEMLIVLVIVSVLSLLIIPNVGETTKTVNKEAEYALTQVVKTQASLYRLEKGVDATYESLQAGGYLTKEQVDKATMWEISVP